jgi:hypothetical protein
VRLAGSGGKYTGRNSATRPDNVRIDRSQPIRSAITVAGIVGYAANNSRICGSTTSTIDPASRREYFGGRSATNAALTVFFEHPNTRAITLIGIFSARCNRLISAQSSTHNTPSSSLARWEPGSPPKGSKFGCRAGVIFRDLAQLIELALLSCGEQDAFAEQVEFGAAVHLSFDHFDAVDGAFDGA